MNTFNAYNFLLLYIIIILSVAKLDFLNILRNLISIVI